VRSRSNAYGKYVALDAVKIWGSISAPPFTEYDDTNANIIYTRTWRSVTASQAHGGSYGRSATKGAAATVWFTGTQIDWIATEGATTGTADVYLDGTKVASVSLAANPIRYKTHVYSSPILPNGLHSLRIVNTSTKYLILDAVAIAGTISAPPKRYEAADSHIVKTGSWATYPKTAASGGSYGRSCTSGASATITFSGTRLDWIAMKGTTAGTAYVYLDGATKPTATIHLHARTASYQVIVWSTGTLSTGTHTVRIVRDDKDNTPGQFITLDAVDIWGTILSPAS